MVSGLDIVRHVFGNWRQTEPVLRVEAEIETEIGTAHVLKLDIELLEDVQGMQSFSLRLAVERGDGSIGIHQRSLTGFEVNQHNAIGLIGMAFAEFADVDEKDKT